jgi:hypothetical protein
LQKNKPALSKPCGAPFFDCVANEPLITYPAADAKCISPVIVSPDSQENDRNHV